MVVKIIKLRITGYYIVIGKRSDSRFDTFHLSFAGQNDKVVVFNVWIAVSAILGSVEGVDPESFGLDSETLKNVKDIFG